MVAEATPRAGRLHHQLGVVVVNFAPKKCGGGASNFLRPCQNSCNVVSRVVPQAEHALPPFPVVNLVSVLAAGTGVQAKGEETPLNHGM